ncbi:MAG: deoxyribodipyrimidine photo-lyase [Cyanobacteria bacterium SZAS TMP-1]|nr:deoxyribodipyrimidine photo-lyase [Cyanobacteria bacterium SZAS TMP-1]
MTTGVNPDAAPAIVWFRQDLRLADQPALYRALEDCSNGGGHVLPVFIWAPAEEAPWAPGAASRVWLHFSLTRLAADIKALGSQLLIFDCSTKGSSLEVIEGLCAVTGAGSVYWNRRYEPVVIERDKKIKTALKEKGLTVHTFNGSLLLEPWELATQEGKPYQVFTPFWRACQLKLQTTQLQHRPLEAPGKMSFPAELTQKLAQQKSGYMQPTTVDALGLLPVIKWDKGIRESWQPGEKGASEQLEKFMRSALRQYKEGRDRPELEGVSRMSQHLHFGEISPQIIWDRVQKHARSVAANGAGAGAEAYLRELGWREFSHHLLYHFPQTPTNPLRQQFENFPWSKDNRDQEMTAWTRGLTGYPIVDAGMRELWHTGIMHNRVRMIVASFLVKDLLIPWQEGARWFWDTLVDADLAQNTLGWQWTAGCGADAAPYFRIFNPILQGEKFDPDGNYVRRWVPELAQVKSKWIHKPWLAPEADLRAAGVKLGDNYPAPMVDHSYARDRALTAFKQLKTG